MGKNLHYTIRPFIENALNGHTIVEKIEPIECEDFYVYKITRKDNLSSLIVVLVDDYYYGLETLQSKPIILKDGGFVLIARPEANGLSTSLPSQKLGIGKIGKLLGAINREDFWNYEPPSPNKKKN